MLSVEERFLRARRDVSLRNRVCESVEQFRLDRHGEARFTFDTFRVGPANEVAAAAARTILSAAAPTRLSIPVFFYGDYGVGKTHLMHAVATAVEQDFDPESARRSLYLTAEEFLSGFVTAMKARDTMSFKEYSPRRGRPADR